MNNLNGKKLLILCGNVVHVKVVEAAREMGVYTVVTDSLSLADAPAKAIADEALYFNVLDVEAIVAWCRENKIDGVLNFCNDIGQRPHQQICEKLGLPCYGTAEHYFTLTDKNAFKEMCRTYGIDIIPQYSESDIEKDVIDYPVFIKPVDSRGSRGQAVCNNSEELMVELPKTKKESTNGQVIIEKYMVGKQDFSMSYVIKDGELYLTRTGDRYLGRVEDGLNKQCIGSVSPSSYTEKYIKNVEPRIKKAIQGMGIKNGTVFMQGFIDGDTVRFYDPGLRLPGTEYEKLLYKATGINLMKEMIKWSLNEEIDDYQGKLSEAYRLNGKVSVQLLVSARGGTIKTFSGLEKIAQNPNVVTVAQRYFVGETVPQTGDVKQRICEIVVLADKKEVYEVVKWVQAQLIVLDEKDENMLVSQFNAEVLLK